MLASRNNQAKHNITVIKIGDCDITPSPTARHIGAVFDSEMSMVSHVKYIYTLLMLNVDTLQMRNSRNLSLFATGTHKE